MNSYSSSRLGLARRASELFHLYRRDSRNVERKVQTILQRLAVVERRIEEHTGIVLRDKQLLDIGPGQKLDQMVYFARHNQVTGIDLDVIAQGVNPLQYVRMARANGPIRAAKTLGRKLLAVDRRWRREFSRQLDAERPRRLQVLQMDVTGLKFPDAAFDFAYSFSTFEHLPDPARALDEIKRVVRPGGGMYISLHLYTSDGGCHDPRVFADRRDDLPRWPHLRPSHAHLVRPNAYLNRLRMPQWREMFAASLPGSRIEMIQYGADRWRPEVERLHAAGELTEYTADELLTVDLAAIWKKPE